MTKQYCPRCGSPLGSDHYRRGEGCTACSMIKDEDVDMFRYKRDWAEVDAIHAMGLPISESVYHERLERLRSVSRDIEATAVRIANKLIGRDADGTIVPPTE